MTTLTLVAGAPPRDRLEWAAVAGLLGFVSALQLSIAAASICLAVTLTCWAGALVLGQERWDAPRFFWPLLVYAAWTLDLGRRLARPAHQLRRLQAAGRLPARAGGLPTGTGQPRADDLQRHHHGRRRQRDSRHRPVRAAQLRPPRAAATGRDGALHDLLGSAGAGHRRRRRAPAVRYPPLRVVRHRDARAGRGHRAHLHAQRLGGRGRRRRGAVHPQGRAAAGAAAGDRRRGVPAGARSDHRPLLLDVRSARSHQPRSRGDAVRRPQDDRGASDHRRRARTWWSACTRSTATRRRSPR